MRPLLICAVLTFLLLGACKPECGGNTPCPMDPPRGLAQGNACTALVSAYSNEPCQDVWSALVNCNVDNTACGADGMTDALATSERRTAHCTAQLGAYASCCSAEPGSGFCSTSTD